MSGPDLSVLTLYRNAYQVALKLLYYSRVTHAVLRARCRGGRGIVLCYHGVEDTEPDSFDPNQGLFVSPAEFERQVRLLRREFSIVPLNEMIEVIEQGGRFDGPTAVVTFDDGYRSVATVAGPVLQKYNAPATVFLATGFMGGALRPWWHEIAEIIDATTSTELAGENGNGKFNLSQRRDKQRLFAQLRSKAQRLPPWELEQYVRSLRDKVGIDKPVRCGSSLMSWDDARGLLDSGLVEFGSHTVTHTVATVLPVPELEDELRNSKATIEAELGREVTSFAYPFGQRGDYSNASASLIKKTGYRCALVASGGFVSPRTDAWQLPRIGVSGMDHIAAFAAKLAGIESVARSMARVLTRSKQVGSY